MKYKKSVILILLAIFLFAMATASASDANDTAIASEDTGQMELSSSNVITGDNLQTSEDEQMIQADNEEKIIGNDNGTSQDKLGAEGEGTYYDLRDEIGDGGDKSLTKSYYSYTGGDTIEITKSGVINGNGAVIDMAGSNIRAFYVSASGVTIKDLTIKNAYHAGDGGAIYFSSSGTVENCNFINNTADDTGHIMDGAGGAIYFSVSGTVENCNFTNNAVSGDAGAIYGGSAVNCIFTGNTASVRGGAMYGGSAVNCIFTGNTASVRGGAMSEGSAVNCTFSGNNAEYGGAMHYGSAVLCILKTSSDTLFYTDIPNTFTVSKSVFRFDLGDRLLFNLTYDNKNYDGYNTTITLTKDGDLVGVYYALSGSDEGWFMNLDQGRYSAVLSLEQYEAIPITVDIFVGIDAITYSVLSNEIASGGDYIKLMFSEYTYDYGSTIEINRPNTVIDGNGAVIDMAGSNIRALTVSASNVTIKNLTIKNANFDGDGGAIYFDTQGTVENCKFTDNQALGGGAVYFSSSGSAINCKFTDNQAQGGGAVYFSSSGSAINCKFTDNQAQGGGAVYFSSSGSAINCNFANNTASNGGAIYILASCTVMNCNFTNNTASNGGAIYSCLRKSAATIIITNNAFTDNSAQDNGGAIYNYLWRIEGTTTIKDNTFTGNAAKDGTAIYTECGYEDLQRIDLESNNFNSDNYTFYTWDDDANITVVGNTLEDIQACVDHAKDGYTIYLEGIEYNGTTEVYVNKTLTFVGKENTTLRVQDAVNIFSIDQDAFNITFKNIRFTNGCINFVAYNLNLINCTFDNNCTYDYRSGRYVCVNNPDSNVTLLNSSFTNNIKYGALYLQNFNSFLIDNCIFSNNQVNVGYISLEDSMIFCEKGINVVINNSTFTNNHYHSSCLNLGYLTNLNVTNCIFEDNAGYSASSICLYSSYGISDNATINIEYCDFINNKESRDRHYDKTYVVYIAHVNNDYGFVINMENCNFKDNSVGCFYFEYNHVNDVAYINNCSFTNNYPNRELILSHNKLKIDDSIFENNTGDMLKIGSTLEDWQSFENCSFKNNSGNCIVLSEFGNGNVSVFDCEFENNSGSGISIKGPLNSFQVLNCSFKNNSNRGINILSAKSITILDCDFKSNPGGGINIGEGCDSTLIDNCNFTDNSATYGGAISIVSDNARILNCNFEKNCASNEGGAIYNSVYNSGECPDNFTMKNCSFINNSAHMGGAVRVSFDNSRITNCSFINNFVFKKPNQNLRDFSSVGALDFSGLNSILANCSFISNAAHTDEDASSNGAVDFYSDNGILANCSFINNSATFTCSALYFGGVNAILANCTFENNRVTATNATIQCYSSKSYGVVICSSINGTIINCSFTNNSIISQKGLSGTWGGAIYINGMNCTVNHCEFINNSIRGNSNVGGAIYVYIIQQGEPGTYINILDSVFVNNSAISNNGTAGGAISINANWFTNSAIINCTFENNSAHGGYQKNILFDSKVFGIGGAAIYYNSYKKEYHHTIINSTFKSNKEYGVYFTSIDDNTSITLGLEAYESLINAIYVNGPYYNPASTTLDFYNVTYWDGDEEFNTDEVYPVASTLLKNQVFFLEIYDSQGNLIDNVTVKGTGKIVYDYTNLPMGVYTYFAYHPDNEYYGYSEVSGSFEVGFPFDSLNEKIKHGGNITLKRDYVFDSENCSAYIGGFVVDKNVTIYGNGHVIDAMGIARIFNVAEGASLTLVNVTLKNGQAEDGGAIYSKGTLVIINSTLQDNHASAGGAIYEKGNLTLINSVIDNNTGKWGAIELMGTGTIVNSTLSNNSGEWGGAIYSLSSKLTITGSNITDNYARVAGAGVYNLYDGTLTISNSTLKDNRGNLGTAIWASNGDTVELNNVRLVDNEGDALHANDGVAIDTSGVKFLTALSFKIEDINDTLKGSEITINITEQNKGKEFSGNVTVFIGDENYTVEIINGTGLKKVIPNLSLGIYTARLIFNETDVYYSACAEGNPFHIRAKPEISIGIISDVDEGNPVTIKVTALESFNEELILTINGANYTVSMVNGSGEKTLTLSPGTYNATIRFTGNDCYTADDALSNVFIVRENINGIRIALSKNTFTYNAKVQRPTVTLSNGLILKEGVDYTLKWSNLSPKNAGTYTITVTGIGPYYTGTAKVTFKINKAANPLKVKAKTVKVKFSKLKKKAQTLKVTKLVKFTKKGQGTLTYKKVKGNKKITINKKTGKVTIKKGLKKGTYKVKVKIKANGNANYKASAFKTITFKIKIK